MAEEEIGEKKRYRSTEKTFRVLKYFVAVERELPALSP